MFVSVSCRHTSDVGGTHASSSNLAPCRAITVFMCVSTTVQVIQTYARANKLPLDVMMFQTEVTNKTVEQVTEAAPLGCYIHGCVLEGARWVEGRLKLHCLV